MRTSICPLPVLVLPLSKNQDMLRKIILALLALVFALFAYWQLNDNDPTLWVPVYGGVALLLAANAFAKVPSFLNLLGTLGLFIGASTYLPDVYEWYQEGMPSITGAMKAGSPYIENMREFLGLVLAGITMLGAYRTGK